MLVAANLCLDKAVVELSALEVGEIVVIFEQLCAWFLGDLRVKVVRRCFWQQGGGSICVKEQVLRTMEVIKSA